MEELKRGDHFVPTGGTYPADAYQVFDDANPARLSIVPMSGGRVFSVPRSEIQAKGFRKVDPETEPKQLRPARFALGHSDYKQAHPGYTFGDLWNGWECPYFPRESADAIALEMNAGLGAEGITYDPERDAYVINAEAYGYDPGDEPEIVKAERIPGADVPVYAIGNRSWCWEEVAPPESR